MNRAIRASKTNIDMIAAENGLRLKTVQGNVEGHLYDHEEFPIIFLSGSKEEDNLVVTYQHTLDFERHHPGITVTDTEYTDVPRLSR